MTIVKPYFRVVDNPRAMGIRTSGSRRRLSCRPRSFKNFRTVGRTLLSQRENHQPFNPLKRLSRNKSLDLGTCSYRAASNCRNAERTFRLLLGDTDLGVREGSIKTPLLLFLRTGDYFFSLLTGSIFSFFISLPMAVVLPTPSFSAVWSSNCPVAFKPLAS